MRLIICFSIALALFIGSIAWAITATIVKRKSRAFLKPINIFILGTSFAGALLFYPINYDIYVIGNANFFSVFKTVILSIHDLLGLYVLNGNFETVNAFSSVIANEFLKNAYPILLSVIYIIAPILTFGFILSFFKNIVSYVKYLTSFHKNVYVFSEMNEYSIALAVDIAKNHPKALLVFTNASNEDGSYDGAEKLQGLNVIFFKKDLTLTNLNFHSKKSKITFFLISDNEDKNVKQFAIVNEKYKDRDFTQLYLFSSSVQSDMLLSNSTDGKIVVRRINPASSLIYRNLYDNGFELFKNAKEGENGKKVISAVIVGMGNYGSNLTKTLAWFCQMDGYTVKINSFDKSPDANDIFSSSCPELMDKKYNGKLIDGEAEYDITVHSGYDYKSIEFDKQIEKIKDATYVFVSIGSDEQNIDCAVKLRMLFERNNLHPVIKAVVYNGELKTSLENAVNFKGQPYDVTLIGDVESTYCEKVIIHSELEKDALARHKKYGAEESFWQFEYNNKSSMASAIHMRARIKCGIKGADKKEEDLTKEEADNIEVLEHKRWNAYMRSEGYVYKKERNDLAKAHHNLVCFDTLSEEDKRKDRRVGSK